MKGLCRGLSQGKRQAYVNLLALVVLDTACETGSMADIHLLMGALYM